MTQRILLKWDGKSTAVDFNDSPLCILHSVTLLSNYSQITRLKQLLTLLS